MNFLLTTKVTLAYCFGMAFFTANAIHAQENSVAKRAEFQITHLTDVQYPDNPDIGFTASSYDHQYFLDGSIELASPTVGTFTFNSDKGAVTLTDIDLMEFMPTAPEHLRSDEYLTFIALINQEWNRNQVQFRDKEFSTTNKSISRVDLARNCLNSYLWEIILYTDEGGKEMPLAHGWFSFPKDLYSELFERRNGLKFSKFKASLENWIDPESKLVNLELLRSDVHPIESTSFQDCCDEMYPLKQARLKKKKDIIHPSVVHRMVDFHTDESLFATFANPGFYTRATPRVTELGRFQNLSDFSAASVTTPDGRQSTEFVLTFNDDKDRTTKLHIGGLDVMSFPALDPDDANSGYKISMGFSNHTFYEAYKDHLAWDSGKHPYYGFLSDGDGNWLDSHKIGIDGPIFHWDKTDPTTLHLWFLSFERHALVGHYTIKFAEDFEKVVSRTKKQIKHR